MIAVHMAVLLDESVAVKVTVEVPISEQMNVLLFSVSFGLVSQVSPNALFTAVVVNVEEPALPTSRVMVLSDVQVTDGAEES